MTNIILFHKWLIIFSLMTLLSLIMMIVLFNKGHIFGFISLLLIFLVSFYITTKISIFYSDKKKRAEMIVDMMHFSQVFDNISSDKDASVFSANDISNARKSPRMFTL